MALCNFWFSVLDICTVVTIIGKQCWSQAVLELGSWGHSVLQTPALVRIRFFNEVTYHIYLNYSGILIPYFLDLKFEMKSV